MTPDLSHAIEQLRWLIENDFADRRGTVYVNGKASLYWWQEPSRRKDVQRLRSYISGVRVLEAAQRKALDHHAVDSRTKIFDACDLARFGQQQKDKGRDEERARVAQQKGLDQ
jgi:hypothetical protein